MECEIRGVFLKRLLLLFFLLIGFCVGALYMTGAADDIRMKLADAMDEGEDTAPSVLAEGDVSADAMKEVRTAASEMGSILNREMDAPLPPRIRIYVAGSQETYARVLAEHFSLTAKEADEVAAISGGWSGGKRRVTAINGASGVMKGRSDRIHTTGHELFHQAQYALSEGKDTDEKALFWLEEGTADYMGALLAERMKGRSREKWIADIKVELLSAPKMVRMEDLQHLDFAERKHIMGKDYHAYSLADLMTWYLVRQLPEGTEGTHFVAYFRLLGTGVSGETAFEQVFGMKLDAFLAAFHAWWTAESSAPLAVRVEADESVQPKYAQEIQKQVEFSRRLVEQRLGKRLHGTYALVLAGGKENFVRAISARCDVDEAWARELAGASLWVENGSMILLNAEELTSPQQILFSMGTMMARVFERQYMASDTEEPLWLVHGVSYLMGMEALSESGYGAPRDYRRTWLLKLHEAAAIPSLAALGDEADYRRAAETYGNESISLVMEVGAYELLSRGGWGAVSRWLGAVRESGDGRRAFGSVWGISAKDFADGVDRMIQGGAS